MITVSGILCGITIASTLWGVIYMNLNKKIETILKKYSETLDEYKH